MIVSFQMDERRVSEAISYHVTMVIKSKKNNNEGTLLAQLQDFEDVTIHRIE
jgi:putative Mg2+ transporter-C (MgtC) family protein